MCLRARKTKRYGRRVPIVSYYVGSLAAKGRPKRTKGRQIWPPPWAAKGPATPLLQSGQDAHPVHVMSTTLRLSCMDTLPTKKDYLLFKECAKILTVSYCVWEAVSPIFDNNFTRKHTRSWTISHNGQRLAFNRNVWSINCYFWKVDDKKCNRYKIWYFSGKLQWRWFA